MKTIPIYDATTPIVCTARAAEVPRRIDEIERLRANVIDVERGEHGMLLHFSNRPDLDEELRRFALDEKQCCQFCETRVPTTSRAVAGTRRRRSSRSCAPVRVADR